MRFAPWPLAEKTTSLPDHMKLRKELVLSIALLLVVKRMDTIPISGYKIHSPNYPTLKNRNYINYSLLKSKTGYSGGILRNYQLCGFTSTKLSETKNLIKCTELNQKRKKCCAERTF